MTMAHPSFQNSELAGVDCSWIAVDRDGHVAWFVTFGSAVVPPGLESTVLQNEGLEDSLKKLPLSSEASPVLERSVNSDDWQEIAMRGIFTYDYSASSGPYDSIYVPTEPLHVEELPSPLRNFALQSRFADFCFSDREEITVNDVLSVGPGSH